MDVDSPNSLKRCSSAPQINNLLPSAVVGVNHPIVPMDEGQSQQDSTVAGSTQVQQSSLRQTNPINNGTNNSSSNNNNNTLFLQHQHQSPNHLQSMSSSSTSNLHTSNSIIHRDPPPTSFSNIFTRTRRFSASFSPLAVISNGSSSPSRSGSCTPGPRLTPRISQLRQEECADVSNSREVNHEREVHSAMQMSQSYEDLTLFTENWSFSSGANQKANEDLGNPLHVALPSIGTSYCSSPSPTSRGGLGLQYPTTSPSPTRKFVTRRSMSPCPIRPSPLSSSVKRKFDLDDNYGNCCSPPPLKKIFTSERGSSPSCQTPSPSPICASPDSSTASFENGSNNASSSGRITPKFFVTKLGSGQLSLPGSVTTGGTPHTGGVHHGNVAGLNTASTTTLPLHTDSPPSSSSSSSLMMMDCGVSSSSGHHNQPDAAKRLPLEATVSSSAVETKIDCDEDITDLNAMASSSSMATTESSEAVMEEVIKTTRALEERSESELLDSSSSVSNSHRLSTGSISSASNDNNSESTSSLCPLAFGAGVLATAAGGTNGAAAFLASNIEIAET